MPKRPTKYPVRRCSLVGCRGGQNGCNGSECRGARWDHVTVEEAYDLYGIVIDKPDAEDCNTPQLGNQRSCGVEQSGSSQGS